MKVISSSYEDFFEQVISFCFSVCYTEAGLGQLDHDRTVEIWRENGLLEETKEEFKRKYFSIWANIALGF